MRQDPMERLSRYRLRVLSTSVAICLLRTLAMAQIDPHQTYLVLSTSKTTTLQEEIDDATAEGFRIVATASMGGGQVALMRRSASKEEDFSYRVLGATKISTLEKELNEAAAAGYSFLRGTMLTRDRPLGPPEVVAFLERSPESSRECEYRVLGTSRTGKLEDELVAVEEEGFRIVGIAQASELAAVLERQR